MQPQDFEFSPQDQAQVASFLDSGLHVDPRLLGPLIRALQANPPERRQAFFAEVRACRRRPVRSWRDGTVARALVCPDDYHHLEFEARPPPPPPHLNIPHIH